MPKVKISAERLAMARSLEADQWTHGRIATLFSVERSTVTNALRHRKTMLPSKTEQLAADMVEKITLRALRAASRAVAQELRQIADEMGKEPTP